MDKTHQRKDCPDRGRILPDQCYTLRTLKTLKTLKTLRTLRTKDAGKAGYVLL